MTEILHHTCYMGGSTFLPSYREKQQSNFRGLFPQSPGAITLVSVFSLTQFSILSVAHSAAPAISTSPSSWWQQRESLCLLRGRSLDSHSECAGVQCPLPDIKISLVPSASNTHFVVVVFFPNHSSLMFLWTPDCSYLSRWQETEGDLSKGTDLQPEKSVSWVCWGDSHGVKQSFPFSLLLMLFLHPNRALIRSPCFNYIMNWNEGTWYTLENEGDLCGLPTQSVFLHETFPVLERNFIV